MSYFLRTKPIVGPSVLALLFLWCAHPAFAGGHPHGGGGGHMPSPPRMSMPSPPRMRMPTPPQMHAQAQPRMRMPATAKVHNTSVANTHANATPRTSLNSGAAKSNHIAGSANSAHLPGGRTYAFHPKATASAAAPLKKPGAVTNPNFGNRYWGYHHHYNGYRRNLYRRSGSYRRGLYGNQNAMRWLMRLRRDLAGIRRNAPANSMHARNLQRDLFGVVRNASSRPSAGQVAQLAGDSASVLARRNRPSFDSMNLARHYMTVMNRGQNMNRSYLQRAISGSHSILLGAGVGAPGAGQISQDLSSIAGGGGMMPGQLGFLN